MHVEHRWLVPDRVVYLSISGDITPEDFEALNDRKVSLIDAGKAPVHMIYQMKNVNLIDHRPSTEGLKRILNTEKLGWYVAIDADLSAVRRALGRIALAFSRMRWRVVTSFDEAAAFIKKKDPSLQDVPFDKER